ncbi:MAG: response regulator [Nannocystaceae bacterium]
MGRDDPRATGYAGPKLVELRGATITKVLFVDDEPAVVRAVTVAFERDAFELRVASRGDQALRVLEHDEIDVLVSDEHMPGMRGSELVARVAKSFPDIVRILITGRPSVDTTLDAINHGGVFRYLTKPFSMASLRTAPTEAGVRRREHQVNTELLRLARAQVDLVRGTVAQDPTTRPPPPVRPPCRAWVR